MLALVEGKHATGKKPFHVTAMTGTEFDREDNNDDTQDSDCRANHDGLTCTEQSFYEDWVCFVCYLIHILMNDIMSIESLPVAFSQGNKEL